MKSGANYQFLITITTLLPTQADLPLHAFELRARLAMLPALGGAPRAATQLRFSLHPLADDDDDDAGFSNLPLAQLPADLAAAASPALDAAPVPCVATTASDGRARSACAVARTP